MILPLVLFAIVYVLLSMRHAPISRALTTTIGAAILVITRSLGFRDALDAVDLGTIALLAGMMVIAEGLRDAKVFHAIARALVVRAKSPRRLLAFVIVASGVASALLVNDVACVILAPAVLAMIDATRIDRRDRTRHEPLAALPYLLAIGLAANVGGVATLAGNPQNVLVGRASHIPFGAYALVATPIAIVGLAIVYVVVASLYRRDLAQGRLVFESTTNSLSLADRRRGRIFLSILALVSIGFFAPLPIPIVALVGAAAVLIVERRAAVDRVRHIDASVLLFFAGLFIVVRGVGSTHVVDAILAKSAHMWSSRAGEVFAFGGLAAIGSNIVSNVPFVLLATPAVRAMHDPRLGFYVLAIASSLAGNLTLVGSVANLIVVELARGRANVGFVRFFVVGFPITLLTLAFALVYLASIARWIAP